MEDQIKIIKRELQSVQRRLADCVTESGYVRTHARYHYALLVAEARELQNVIDIRESVETPNKTK